MAQDNIINNVVKSVKSEIAASSPEKLGLGGLILGYILSTDEKERNAVISGAIAYFGADKIKELAGAGGKTNASK